MATWNLDGLDDGPDYIAVTAMLASACPFCPEEILPGDSITQRRPGEEWCHRACAFAEDDREEHNHDLGINLAVSRRFRRRAYRDRHGRLRTRAGLRPLKRKQRVPTR